MLGKMSVEDNSFGTHEFFELCSQIGCEPYINGNVGSGTVQEMSEWIEYILLVQKSWVRSLFYLIPRTPFVYDEFHLMFRIIFAHDLQMAGCEPYINGNVGSGTVQEMSEWIEYMTFDGESPMANQRAEIQRPKCSEKCP